MKKCYCIASRGFISLNVLLVVSIVMSTIINLSIINKIYYLHISNKDLFIAELKSIKLVNDSFNDDKLDTISTSYNDIIISIEFDVYEFDINLNDKIFINGTYSFVDECIDFYEYIK